MRPHVSFIAFALALVFSSVAFAQISDAPLEQLVTQLSDENVDRRRDAAYELVRRQVDSEAVVAAFAKAVSDSDAQVQFQALMGLARIADSAAAAIPQLVECLDDREDQVRYRAADALGKIGTPAIEPLIAAWSDAGEREQIAISQALATIGPRADTAKSILNGSLSQAVGELAGAVAVALNQISPGDEDLIIRFCQHSEAEVRRVGISALASVKSPSAAALEALESAMQDDDPRIRETAVIALAKSNLDDAKKESLLEAGLLDDAVAVRAAANVGLRKAKLNEKQFAGRLAKRLSDANPIILASLFKALEQLGPEAKDALPQVLDSIERHASDSDGSIEPQLAVETLASFGDSVVDQLLEAIEQRPAIEPILARTLAAIGDAALPRLMAGMDSESELIRLASTRAIGALRELESDHLGKLAAALEDSSASVRSVAVEVLIQRNINDDEVKSELLAATTDSDPKVRAAALQVLSRFELKDQQAIGILEPALNDPAFEVRANALEQVLAVPSFLPKFQATVLKLADDAEALVRERTARLLAKWKADQVDQATVEVLVKLMRDIDADVCIAATESAGILKIDNPQVYDALAESLAREPKVVLATLETIKLFGDKVNSLKQPLSKLLSHSEANIRSAAVDALTKVDTNAESLAATLLPVLDDSEWEVRRVAGVSLGKLGPAAKSATIKLFLLLESEQDSDYASSALREIDAAPEEAVDLLIENLGSEDRRKGFYAITLLGKIGPPAKSALPKLEAMLEEGNDRDGGNRRDFRRQFLRDAIARIKGEQP